ncbi:M10 family metallopeptidase C-terminal domain-containing protein [Siccirubricoccus sp. G192]|nr:M10 family metallopeptidase C-terminal domain-containing protein [Siccirubricoccus sp. G192]
MASARGHLATAPGGSANRIFLTVWTAGADATYDFSNYATGVSADLRPGQWSVTSQTQLSYLGDGHYARGNVFNALEADGNPASLVRNAVGTAQADTIIGNEVSNTLTGGKGNDTLTGGGGTDTFILWDGDGADIIADFASGQDMLLIHGVAASQVSINDAASGGLTVSYGGARIFLAGLAGLSTGDIMLDSGAMALMPTAPPAQIGNGTNWGAAPAAVTVSDQIFGGQTYTITATAAAWNTVKGIQAAPPAWDVRYDTHLAYDNFVVAKLDLRAAGTRDLDILEIGAKRGEVTLGDGDDVFTWIAHSNGGAISENTMVIRTGQGNNTVRVSAAGLSTLDDGHNSGDGSLWNPSYTGNKSAAEVFLGNGNDTIVVDGWVKLIAHGGSGYGSIKAGAGADTIIAGSGGGEFSGGTGKDTFVFAPRSRPCRDPGLQVRSGCFAVSGRR